MNTTLGQHLQLKICRVLEMEKEVIVRFHKGSYYTNHICLLITMFSTTIATILLNSTAILTFCMSHNLNTSLHYFLVFLQSVFDLGIGLLVSPYFCAKLMTEAITAEPNCTSFYLFYNLFFISIVSSVAMLSAMSLERYLSIIHPVYHRAKLTKKWVTAYICCIFIPCFIVSVVPKVLGSNKPLVKFYIAVYAFHTLSVVYMYGRIFRVAKASNKKNFWHGKALKNIKNPIKTLKDNRVSHEGAIDQYSRNKVQDTEAFRGSHKRLEGKSSGICRKFDNLQSTSTDKLQWASYFHETTTLNAGKWTKYQIKNSKPHT